jgi:hypothetical protein
MKPEYKEKVLNNLEAMGKRVKDIQEITDGKRPGDLKTVQFSLIELKRLIENSEVIVSIS